MAVIEAPQTREHLKMYLESYKTINEQAERQLHARGQQEKEIAAMKKVMSYVSINAQTMADRTPTHIAEIMMQGNVMGIIDITKTGTSMRTPTSRSLTLATR